MEAATQKATQGGRTEAENALRSQELALGGSAHPAGDAHQGKPPNGTIQPQDQEKPNPAGCRGYSRVAQLRSANSLRPALGWDTAVHTDPRDPPRLRGRTKATAAPCWHGAPGSIQGTQLSARSVTRGPAPATTASLFNSQQLRSHSARQIDFTSPQLNVDNYGCLHQGTALPGLRRKNHIPIPLML